MRDGNPEFTELLRRGLAVEDEVMAGRYLDSCSHANFLAACCYVPDLLLLRGTPIVPQVSGNQLNG
jgi:hypothetical protein